MRLLSSWASDRGSSGFDDRLHDFAEAEPRRDKPAKGSHMDNITAQEEDLRPFHAAGRVVHCQAEGMRRELIRSHHVTKGYKKRLSFDNHFNCSDSLLGYPNLPDLPSSY